MGLRGAESVTGARARFGLRWDGGHRARIDRVAWLTSPVKGAPLVKWISGLDAKPVIGPRVRADAVGVGPGITTWRYSVPTVSDDDSRRDGGHGAMRLCPLRILATDAAAKAHASSA